MRHLLETELLCGITHTLDEEEWPLLELEDTTISYNHPRERVGEFVDLFKVHLCGPFRVKGKLGKLKKDQESLALIDVSKLYKDYIFIPKVYTYSLEVKNDGKIIIWVLGNCGWYALSPAKEYQQIFEQMLEKTKIWLFLENKYVPSIYYRGKKKLKGTAQDVFIEVRVLSSGDGSCEFVPCSNFPYPSSQRLTQIGPLRKPLRLYFTSTMSG